MSGDPEHEPTVRVTVTVRLEPPRPEPSSPHAAGYQRGFEDGAAAGCALGRHLEALRWAAELERWRRLVRWTAAQRAAP